MKRGRSRERGGGGSGQLPGRKRPGEEEEGCRWGVVATAAMACGAKAEPMTPQSPPGPQAPRPAAATCASRCPRAVGGLTSLRSPTLVSRGNSTGWMNPSGSIVNWTTTPGPAARVTEMKREQGCQERTGPGRRGACRLGAARAAERNRRRGGGRNPATPPRVRYHLTCKGCDARRHQRPLISVILGRGGERRRVR